MFPRRAAARRALAVTAGANFDADSISARQTANDSCRRPAFGQSPLDPDNGFTRYAGCRRVIAAETTNRARRGNGNDTRSEDAGKPSRGSGDEKRGPIRLGQQRRPRSAEWAGSAVAHSESEIARERELGKTNLLGQNTPRGGGDTEHTHNLLLL